MSNATMAKRIDGEPLDLEILQKTVSIELGLTNAPHSLIDRRYFSGQIDNHPISIRLLREDRCLAIEPRGEPGLTIMFDLCRAYSHNCGVLMTVFDEDYSFFVSVNGGSSNEELFEKLRSDPFEAERILNDMK